MIMMNMIMFLNIVTFIIMIMMIKKDNADHVKGQNVFHHNQDNTIKMVTIWFDNGQ